MCGGDPADAEHVCGRAHGDVMLLRTHPSAGPVLAVGEDADHCSYLHRDSCEHPGGRRATRRIRRGRQSPLVSLHSSRKREPPHLAASAGGAVCGSPRDLVGPAVVLDLSSGHTLRRRGTRGHPALGCGDADIGWCSVTRALADASGHQSQLGHAGAMGPGGQMKRQRTGRRP